MAAHRPAGIKQFIAAAKVDGAHLSAYLRLSPECNELMQLMEDLPKGDTSKLHAALLSLFCLTIDQTADAVRSPGGGAID